MYPDSSDSGQASRAPKLILLTNPGLPSPHHCTDHGLATAFRRHTPHDTSPASVACPSVHSLVYIQHPFAVEMCDGRVGVFVVAPRGEADSVAGDAAFPSSPVINHSPPPPRHQGGHCHCCHQDARQVPLEADPYPRCVETCMDARSFVSVGVGALAGGACSLPEKRGCQRPRLQRAPNCRAGGKHSLEARPGGEWPPAHEIESGASSWRRRCGAV